MKQMGAFIQSTVNPDPSLKFKKLIHWMKKTNEEIKADDKYY
jgi:hypothetical protein